MKIMTSQMQKILEFQEKKFKTTLNKSNEYLKNEFQKIWKELEFLSSKRNLITDKKETMKVIM